MTFGKVKAFFKILIVQGMLFVVTSALASEAPWKLSLRDQLPKTKELGFGRGYDVSSSRIHVPVTPLMADAFDAAPRPEVITFLELLAADEDHREQKGYIMKCIQALKAEEKPTRARWKYADGREVDVIYYHIPFPALPKKVPNQAAQTTPGSCAPLRV